MDSGETQKEDQYETVIRISSKCTSQSTKYLSLLLITKPPL